MKVNTFEYDNKDSLLLSGVSVANSYYGMGEIELYDSKDYFEIIDGLYFWRNRTDNIVKKKGWKQVVEREFEIIEKELSSGNVDPKKYAVKSKEYSDLGNIIIFALLSVFR